MLTFDVKRKINTLRDILVGKVPDPKAQVEQITIALIYKFMDDMDIEGLEFGGTRQFFTGEYEKYAWTEIMKPENSGQQRALLYAEGIEKMTTNPNLPQLFRDIFRGAYIPYRDPDTLNMFLKEVSDFSYDNSEDLGNAFEYLLSIMGSQGDAGQFRTPRHIIDMMVEIIDPKKNETILDPACGTAGFLISGYRHILAQNKDEDGKSTLTADDRKRLTENFAGYDISPDMVRLSRVNMYLHHFTKPKISEYDTLTSEEKWDDCYDVILANPPFMTPKGGIMPHSRYRVKAKRSEVLFVDYIAEHLNPNGRAAIIVPEGIIFQSSNAYKELRKYLVNNDLLYAVISLPAGVFNPYSGVKTSILLIDKLFSKFKDEILFVKLNNDGFDLGAQRQPKKGNEIPEIVRIVKKYHADLDPQITDDEIIHHSLVTIATKEQIAEQNYILVGERYASSIHTNSAWNMAKIGDVCEIERGASPRPINAYITEDETGINWIKIGDGSDNSFYITEAKEKITTEGASKSRYVHKGDLILSNSMSFGKPYILGIDGCVHDGWLILRCNTQMVDQKYLCYILGSNPMIAQYNRLATGGVVKNLNSNLVRGCSIPLPPLEIQKEIVAELDGYQKIIDGARQIVDNYKPTIRINPAWKKAKLGDICNLTYGYTDTAKESGSARFVRITDIDEKGLLRDENKRYVDLIEQNNAFLLHRGDLLVARTGATYGKTLYFDTDETAVFASFLIKLDLPEYIDHYFYWIFAQTQNYWDQANRLVSGGAQPQFNANAIKQLVIPIPSLDVQKSIVKQAREEQEIIDANKKLISIFKQKITDKISEIWGE